MIIQLGKKFPDQPERVSDISSGVLNSSYGLGQMIGPIFGSYFTYLYGFRTCADIVGIEFIVVGILYFIL